jgi:4a-hydroxytetrahydrobiopterin dehydratase
MSKSNSGDEICNETETDKFLQKNLPCWANEGPSICRSYKTSGWQSTLMVVNAVAFLAETGWHHPDLEVSYDLVTVRFTNHDAGGVTKKDLEMAVRVEQLLSWTPNEDLGSVLVNPPNNIIINS